MILLLVTFITCFRNFRTVQTCSISQQTLNTEIFSYFHLKLWDFSDFSCTYLLALWVDGLQLLAMEHWPQLWTLKISMRCQILGIPHGPDHAWNCGIAHATVTCNAQEWDGTLQDAWFWCEFKRKMLTMERYDGSQSDRILPATNGVIQAIQAVSQKDTISMLTRELWKSIILNTWLVCTILYIQYTTYRLYNWLPPLSSHNAVMHNAHAGNLLHYAILWKYF